VYGGERLIVCRDPLLADEGHRKRDDLLAATERDLVKIAAAVTRRRKPLRGREQIALRVGKVLHRFKVGKRFILTLTDEAFGYERDTARIEANVLDAEQTVRAYKDLSKAERAFRSFKTVAPRRAQSRSQTHPRRLRRPPFPNPIGRPGHDRQEPHPTEIAQGETFEKVTPPTPLQNRALMLLALHL